MNYADAAQAALHEFDVELERAALTAVRTGGYRAAATVAAISGDGDLTRAVIGWAKQHPDAAACINGCHRY